MTKQTQQQQGQGQKKRKAEGAAPAGAQPQQGKKAKENKPAATNAAAAAPKKEQAQQQGKGNKGAPQQQQKKKKAPEPEPESDEEEDEDAAGLGEVDEEALAAVAKVQPEMDKYVAELESLDDAMNAEIYAIQKKYLLKKRPVYKKRDALLATVPNLWSTLLSEHQVFASQMEESDLDALKNLVSVEEEQQYAAPDSDKQQITGITLYFTFTAGDDVKAGRFKKAFTFDEEKETLVCVATAAKEMPFVSASFGKDHPDSFFHNWFASEGADEGILAAQDALSSELLLDPLQLFAHLSEGNPMPSMDDQDMSDDDDEDGAAMMFGSDDDDDEEAPQLV